MGLLQNLHFRLNFPLLLVDLRMVALSLSWNESCLSLSSLLGISVALSIFLSERVLSHLYVCLSVSLFLLFFPRFFCFYPQLWSARIGLGQSVNSMIEGLSVNEPAETMHLKEKGYTPKVRQGINDKEKCCCRLYLRSCPF